MESPKKLDVILNKHEKRMLRKVLRLQIIGKDDPLVQQKDFQTLIKYKLITSSSNERFGPTKTADLHRPILNCYIPDPEAEQYVRKAKISDWQEFRAWATLVIALLALVLSVLSLTWQIYKWKSEREESTELQKSAPATMAAHVLTSSPQYGK